MASILTSEGVEVDHASIMLHINDITIDQDKAARFVVTLKIAKFSLSDG